MKVTNPNPCVVNVAVGDGKIVKIGPRQSVDVPKEHVQAALDAGDLVGGSASASKGKAKEPGDGDNDSAKSNG